ncbi:MAG: hypothetical protein Kow00114_14120 [Kiloniellaceae bacterium]
MTYTSEIRASGAEAQTMLQLQDAERLPALLYLWLPLVAAGVLLLTWHLNPGFYKAYVVGEIGILEGSHIVVPLLAAVLALRILLMPEIRRDRLARIWILLGQLGCLYIAGEEASWGQHYGNWLTPESWQAINDQGETNLHNTSSWLDQKPRTLLELGMIVGGIIIPLLALRWPGIRQGRFALFLPPLICLPAAVIGEVAKFWERLHGKLLPDWNLFYNASEVQELYIYLFILFYLIVFRNRVLARRAAGLPARPA